MVAPPDADDEASRAVSLSSEASRPASLRFRMYAPVAGAPSTSSPNSVVSVAEKSRVFIRPPNLRQPSRRCRQHERNEQTSHGEHHLDFELCPEEVGERWIGRSPAPPLHERRDSVKKVPRTERRHRGTRDPENDRSSRGRHLVRRYRRSGAARSVATSIASAMAA